MEYIRSTEQYFFIFRPFSNFPCRLIVSSYPISSAIHSQINVCTVLLRKKWTLCRTLFKWNRILNKGKTSIFPPLFSNPSPTPSSLVALYSSRPLPTLWLNTTVIFWVKAPISTNCCMRLRRHILGKLRHFSKVFFILLNCLHPQKNTSSLSDCGGISKLFSHFPWIL